ncbi:hypothetical protein E2C01_008196 [Portunus trituberculatus]|uniref:Uncharacterized protein n=1 Tax=Portunus trituberculatus TaxID=210409 RepID=A0A5B7D458_PORTR|nr:hypothetical protein [Portunus trituberculatus]
MSRCNSVPPRQDRQTDRHTRRFEVTPQVQASSIHISSQKTVKMARRPLCSISFPFFESSRSGPALLRVTSGQQTSCGDGYV